MDLLDLARRRALLSGEDVLAGITIDRADLRRHCEYELRTKIVGLRQAYLQAGGGPSTAQELSIRAAAGAATLYRQLLALAGRSDEGRPEALAEAVGEAYGVPGAALAGPFVARGESATPEDTVLTGALRRVPGRARIPDPRRRRARRTLRRMQHPRRMLRIVRGMILLLSLLALAFAPLQSRAQAQGAPADSSAPVHLGTARAYVTDDAGALSAAGRERVERYCGKVERTLGVQFAVAVIPRLGSETIEEFAVRQFQEWGVGGAKQDEGLLLAIAVADHKVRFEVGYGLEGSLPDGRVGGIIRQVITPAFRAGDFDGGVLDALVEAAKYVAEDKGLPPPLPDDQPAHARSRGKPVPFWVALLVLVIVMMVLSSLSRGGGGARRRMGPVPRRHVRRRPRARRLGRWRRWLERRRIRRRLFGWRLWRFRWGRLRWWRRLGQLVAARDAAQRRNA